MTLRTSLTLSVQLQGFTPMLDDYYDERGWEIERGIPTKDKLIELGLADVVDDLDKHGILLK